MRDEKQTQQSLSKAILVLVTVQYVLKFKGESKSPTSGSMEASPAFIACHDDAHCIADCVGVRKPKQKVLLQYCRSAVPSVGNLDTGLSSKFNLRSE